MRLPLGSVWGILGWPQIAQQDVSWWMSICTCSAVMHGFYALLGILLLLKNEPLWWVSPITWTQHRFFQWDTILVLVGGWLGWFHSLDPRWGHWWRWFREDGFLLMLPRSCWGNMGESISFGTRSKWDTKMKPCEEQNPSCLSLGIWQFSSIPGFCNLWKYWRGESHPWASVLILPKLVWMPWIQFPMP